MTDPNEPPYPGPHDIEEPEGMTDEEWEEAQDRRDAAKDKAYDDWHEKELGIW